MSAAAAYVAIHASRCAALASILNPKLSMNIQLTPVQSSQIRSIGHDADTGTLAVQFIGRKGAPDPLYHYANVTHDQFEALRNAPSKYKHFAANIKEQPRHPFRKIS